MKWFEKLKFARKVKGLSQVDLCGRIGMSPSYLSAIEKGEIQDLSIFKALRLCAALNLTIEDVWGEDEKAELLKKGKRNE